jgi:antitoxin ParD1/3/4
MANVEKISIALPREMVADIKAAVDGGQYATASEVVRDALRDWTFKRRLEEAELVELRALVLPALDALDRGKGIPADEVLRRLRERYAALAKSPA